MKEALQRLGLPHNSDNYVKALMDQFDMDHDDKVSSIQSSAVSGLCLLLLYFI